MRKVCSIASKMGATPERGKKRAEKYFHVSQGKYIELWSMNDVREVHSMHYKCLYSIYWISRFFLHVDCRVCASNATVVHIREIQRKIREMKLHYVILITHQARATLKILYIICTEKPERKKLFFFSFISFLVSKSKATTTIAVVDDEARLPLRFVC